MSIINDITSSDGQGKTVTNTDVEQDKNGDAITNSWEYMRNTGDALYNTINGACNTFFQTVGDVGKYVYNAGKQCVSDDGACYNGYVKLTVWGHQGAVWTKEYGMYISDISWQLLVSTGIAFGNGFDTSWQHTTNIVKHIGDKLMATSSCQITYHTIVSLLQNIDGLINCLSQQKFSNEETAIGKMQYCINELGQHSTKYYHDGHHDNVDTGSSDISCSAESPTHEHCWQGDTSSTESTDYIH